MSTRPQRWVHVFATFGKGGPQIRAVQLMARRGAGVEHVVIAMDGCTDAAAQAPAGMVVLVPPPPRGGLLATVRRQRRKLRELRPDLVLTYNWGAIESVAAARSLGLPIVHHEDGFLPDEVERRHARRNWTRRLTLRGAQVIVPSSGLAEIARREWGVRDVHHLVNGVDLQRFVPRADATTQGAPLVLGAVGGLRPEKDHATLLRALAEVPDVRLRLVGDGPLRGALEAQARELGVFDRVAFVGSTDDTAAQYRAMDVFVISSCTEQLPLVLLEAMAAGLPVVSTEVGDIARVLPPSAAPLVVPPRQPQRLAQALRTALSDSQLRQQLGRDNRRRAEERFEAGLCLDRFLAVYETVMAKKKA